MKNATWSTAIDSLFHDAETSLFSKPGLAVSKYCTLRCVGVETEVAIGVGVGVGDDWGHRRL